MAGKAETQNPETTGDQNSETTGNQNTETGGNQENETGTDSDSSTDTGGNLRSYIEDIVKQVVGSDSGNAASAPAGQRRSERSNAANSEASIADLVRQEQAKLMKQQNEEAAQKKLSDEVAALKKAVEKPPARTDFFGKVQRFLWGEQ